MPGPIVSCEEASLHLDRPDWVFFDCRHELADPQKGAREHQKAHIPGAFHAHMDRDLSGPVGDGSRGRHPLPIPQAFARWVSLHGVGPQTQVVVYDDQQGQWASRLWWLLRYHGHPADKVALLDGGLTRWKALKLPMRAGHEKPRANGAFVSKPGSMPTVDAATAGSGSHLLVDARAAERYEGKVEPVDKRAGHIPNAVSLPYAGNTGPDNRFLPPDQLRRRFADAGAGGPGVACYCGSGVTSTQSILAMELAGLPTPALYPGSWSEWSFPAAGRAIATGNSP